MTAIYRKGEVLGWGGFAIVYKGWDELLDRPVAIKELVQPFAGSDAFVRAFLAQALRMTDISHRHVLATYGVETRSPAGVLREIAEETLAQQLIEGQIRPEEVLRILRHILAGLDAMHSRDVLHRAVKPENLFASGDVYKVGDFGLPPIEGAPAVPFRHLKYTAPEVLSAQEPIGPGADLYSLGLVVYELLLGSVRFERTIEETLRRAGASGGSEEDGGGEVLWPLFHGSPAELPTLHELETSIPVALSLVVQKMICKNPEARYSSCKEVLAAMGAAGLVEIPGGTQALTFSVPAPAPPRSQTLLWMSAGVSAALVLSGVALFLGVHSRGRENTGAVAPDSELITEAPMPSASSGFAESTPQAGEAVREGDATALTGELLSLRTSGGLTLDLDPPLGKPARLPVGSPLGFRIASDRPGYFALFAVSPDGSVVCLHADPGKPTAGIAPGRSLVLPSSEDRRDGFDLVASEPLGKDLIFLLASDEPLPPLPASGAAQTWVTEYPFTPGPGNPALRFMGWISRLRRDHPDSTRLAAVEIEVVSQR